MRIHERLGRKADPDPRGRRPPLPGAQGDAAASHLTAPTQSDMFPGMTPSTGIRVRNIGLRRSLCWTSRERKARWREAVWAAFFVIFAAGGICGFGPPAGGAFGLSGDAAAPAHTLPSLGPAPAGPSGSSAGYLSGAIDLYEGGSAPPSDLIRASNGLGGMVVNSGTGNLWIADSNTSSVAIYNISTRSIQTVLGLPRPPANGSEAGPMALALDPVHSLLYASAFLSDFISVVNTTSKDLVGTIAVGTNLTDLAWGNGSLFAADPGANTVDVIATTTESLVATIPVGADPIGLSDDAVHHRLFVLEAGVHRLAIVNTTSRKVVQSVSVGSDATGLAYDPANGLVYVANRSTAGPTALSELEAIRASNGTVERTIDLPITGADRPVYLPAQGEVLVTNSGPTIAIVNDTNNSVTYDPAVGLSSSVAAYDPATTSTFVLDPVRPALEECTGAQLGLTGLFPLGGTPAGFAFDPAASELFLSNRGGADVVGVDVSTDRVVAGIPVGSLPEGIAYDPADASLYVADSGSSEVSVFNATPHSLATSIQLNNGTVAPSAAAYDPTNQEVYVTASAGCATGCRSFVDALNASSGGVNGSHGSGAFTRATLGSGSLRGLAIDPVTGDLLAAGQNPDRVYVVAPATGSSSNLTAGNSPTGVAYDPMNQTIYVTNANGSNVSGFNASTYLPSGSISVGSGSVSILYDPSFDSMLVSLTNGSLVAFNATTGALTTLSGAYRPIAAPEEPIGYANLTGLAYAGTAPDHPSGAASTLETVAPSTGGPVVSALAAEPDPAEEGRPLTFTVNASGGSGALTYAFVGLHSNCSSANTATLTCVPNATGELAVTVVVTDGIGRQASAMVLVPILPRLVAGSITQISGPTLTGQLVTFEAATTGGVGPYEVRWGGLPTGCAAASSVLEPCNTTQTGIKTITANVSDADGATASETALSVVFRPPLVVTLTATRQRLDVGQAANLTAMVSGGTGGYTYAWSGLPTGCSSNGSDALTCAPKVAGNWSVTVTTTDAGDFDTGTATIDLESFGPLWVSVPTSNKASVDLGQKVTFNTSWNGGAAPYAFTWGGIPPGCPTSGSASLVCQPTRAGSFHVSVALSDGNGNEATNSSLNFTVYPDPTVRQIQATPMFSVDVGQMVRFFANLTGGSGGFQYAWTGLPPGCLSPDSPYLNCTPLAQGPTVIDVMAVDSNGLIANGSIPYAVYNDPVILRVNTTPAGSVDVGQPVKFEATVIGGSGGNAYAWSGLPSGCAGVTASFSCSPTMNGSFLVRLSVADSNQFKVNSTAIALVVYNDPSVLTPTSSVASADVGQTVTFTSAALGGSGGYTFAWSGLPGNCTGAGNVIRCSPLPSSGNFSINVTVLDSNGETASSGSLFFPVYGDPLAATPSITRASADIGQNVSFSETPSGGSAGYSFLWSGLPPGCVVHLGDVLCTITTADRYSVEVEVTDSNGVHNQSAPVNLTTFADPAAEVPSANRTSADVGQSMTFTERDSGGSGPLDVQWVRLPPGCQSSGATVLCILSSAGNYSVGVLVSDPNGVVNESGPVNVTVDPPFILAGITSSSTLTDVGSPVTFALATTGGSGEATYIWSGLPSGCSTADLAEIRCNPTAPGTWTPQVAATDSNGYALTGPGPSVVVEPSPTFRSAVASPSAITLGATLRLTASVEGGIGPYSFNWSGLPPGCTGADTATLSCHPSASGSYSIGLVVTDARGERVSTTIPVSVGAAFLGLPSAEGYGLVAGAAALVVVLVVAFLLLARRRVRRASKEGGEPPSERPEPPAAEEAPEAARRPPSPPTAGFSKRPPASRKRIRPSERSGVPSAKPQVLPPEGEGTSAVPSGPREVPPAPLPEPSPGGAPPIASPATVRPPPPLPVKPSPSRGREGAGASRCFVCGSELSGTYCPKCKMNWVE
jgi:YVTN family beta-propeller protein